MLKSSYCVCFCYEIFELRAHKERRLACEMKLMCVCVCARACVLAGIEFYPLPKSEICDVFSQKFCVNIISGVGGTLRCHNFPLTSNSSSYVMEAQIC